MHGTHSALTRAALRFARRFRKRYVDGFASAAERNLPPVDMAPHLSQAAEQIRVEKRSRTAARFELCVNNKRIIACVSYAQPPFRSIQGKGETSSPTQHCFTTIGEPKHEVSQQIYLLKAKKASEMTFQPLTQYWSSCLPSSMEIESSVCYPSIQVSFSQVLQSDITNCDNFLNSIRQGFLAPILVGSTLLCTVAINRQVLGVLVKAFRQMLDGETGEITNMGPQKNSSENLSLQLKMNKVTMKTQD